MPARKRTADRALPADQPRDQDPQFLAAQLEVFRCLERNDQFEALLRIAIEWSGAVNGFGLTVGVNPDKLVIAASTIPEDDPRYRSIARLAPAALQALSDGSPSLLAGFGSLQGDLKSWPEKTPAHTLVIPLSLQGGEWAGALLLLLSKQPAAQCAERLGRLSDQLRQALDNAQQVMGLRDLVIKDDTAHCFNRRYFEDFFPEELERSKRFGTPLSLIFLDMDNLKAVNNDHGHAMGSKTLREVSFRIQAKIRKFDKLFRFGGDEFCIILPHTVWQGAMEVAERVRRAIADEPFLRDDLGERGVSMTASLGISAYPLHARTQAEIIEKADRAMQAIKKDEKDGIGIAETAGDGNDE